MLPEPGLKLELFVAPPRRVCMDLILKQCIETGAWAIHTFVAERSVALPVKKSIEQRWRKLMIEACKQSGNPFFPEINLPVSFKDAVDRVGRNGMKAYFGTPGRGKRELPCPPARVAWFVGPEGGFTSEEEDFMAKHGFTGLNIGRWTMRVETAAVCGTALFLF
jgi:16S rRNA (uracil1498-N3)-methyltransferase